ncbi:hypothetical protein LIQ17_06525 [Blautia wexlerae]|nr:hypothetical protein [Blautia wexlerae]
MGVGHIKIIFEGIPAPFRVKYRNAFAVLVDPTLEQPVPCVKLCNGNRIGALGIDQKLLIKAAFVISAGRSQKALPRLRIFRYRHACPPIQLCD